MFIDNHAGLKGIRLSMKGYENQSWLENISLYAFRDYMKQKYM